MAGRRVKPPDIGGMAIDADEVFILIDCCQFLANVLAQTILVVALRTGSNRHVWFEAPQRSRLGYVDVTRSTFGDVVFLLPTAFVFKLQ